MTARNSRGSPFAPHTDEETAAMLEAVGVESVEDLFDIPESVRFDGEFGIDPTGERELRAEMRTLLGRNDDLTEFLGRGHYDHYVPSLVDHLADRSEFLTSYTQYQPEITQGFLQALFEYQSMLVELTGLEIANCSMYDAATALGEAATLADRVRETSGSRILVPDLMREERRSVLENYTEGAGLAVEIYPHDDANADLEALSDLVSEETVMVYAESPTVRGTIEEGLEEVAALAHANDALFALGSDPVALSVLEKPGKIGADVVIGDAATLGLGASYGMGLGLFATREGFVRQVPGRLVGASTDAAGERTYTLTLQTREQHIRRERATSNICTNQAWVALRTAIHAASLGPSGLVDLARECLEAPADLAERLNSIAGVRAPVHDRHHFREFVARTDQPAQAVRETLEEYGFAVHAIDDHLVQVCVTETNSGKADALVTAFREAAR
ncbi:aminomethyl-transferring glycine dehydrogenase subunit GcvPA [Halalkalicoccus sp. NIPERK01]|uniref:aminomethyl-transferring glycine dehydrogenase subunit GcvPA n=1 Tax=Halalkalicoccus sp. NIPERK01 TaxID=3053469 RepID=UPI00256EF531|nr:aminomethyl-transferring glycine dehydrogenase subunit GcvPA [Halalkalicoccus sp. NIPERK01]MDL5361478.1 aminomethyl-transferring glycine dehydrogenase subunit GcvPA [Halalkalicoccus sp. NIPERK01]